GDEHLALFFYQFTPLYGQIPVFVILPVTARIVLRANSSFPRFARNRPHCFTGKSQFSSFCP
ncbi:hypothetical protein, partial [Ligilactobacillus ruminis]|uniref:hypothetical protein n=1 Tax=Ligilactobacillus ruminis TaxID=1623 RepID=UPI002B4B966B